MRKHNTELDNQTLRRLFDKALFIEQGDIVSFNTGLKDKTVFSTGQRQNCLVINFEDPRDYPYSNSLVHGMKIAFPYHCSTEKFSPEATFGAWNEQPHIGTITDITSCEKEDSSEMRYIIDWMLNSEAICTGRDL